MCSIAAQNMWAIIIMIASTSLLKQVLETEGWNWSFHSSRNQTARMVCAFHWKIFGWFVVPNGRFSRHSGQIFATTTAWYWSRACCHRTTRPPCTEIYLYQNTQYYNVRRYYHGCAWVMWATAAVYVPRLRCTVAIQTIFFASFMLLVRLLLLDWSKLLL